MSEKISIFEFEGVRWTATSRGDVEHCFSPQFTRDVVKRNRMRVVTAFCESATSKPKYFLKYDRGRHWKAKLKHFIRSKVKCEFESAQLMASLDIPIVRYIGWGVRGTEGFLLTEAFASAQEAHEVWEKVKSVPLLRCQFISGLCELLHQTVDAGLWHPDLHLGNILVRFQADKLEFRYVDVYGVYKPRSLSVTEKLKMLILILALNKDMTTQEEFDCFRRFSDLFPEYNNDSTKLRRAAWGVLWERLDDFRRKRKHKVLQSSSQLVKTVTKEGTWRIYSDFLLQTAEAAVKAHQEISCNSPDKLMKKDVKRTLSRVEVPGVGTFVVKEFVSPGPWGRWAPDCRSWLSAFGLFQFGLPAVSYYAWLKSTGGPGYIVMEDLGKKDLWASLMAVEHEASQKNDLLVALGRVVGRLHRLGVYHRDLKVHNFVVCDDFQLKLIDLDDVYFYRQLPHRYLLKNGWQILDTLPKYLSEYDKLRILASYHKESGGDKKVLMRDVAELVQTTNY